MLSSSQPAAGTSGSAPDVLVVATDTEGKSGEVSANVTIETSDPNAAGPSQKKAVTEPKFGGWTLGQVVTRDTLLGEKNDCFSSSPLLSVRTVDCAWGFFPLVTLFISRVRSSFYANHA